MFARRFTANSKDVVMNDLNINSSEIFDAIIKDDNDTIQQYLNDPNIKWSVLKDESGSTVLHRAVFKNNYELTNLIIEAVKKQLGLGSLNKIESYINEKTNEGFTALHYAAMNGNIKMVKLLKKYGAKIESVTNLGKNVLHIAAEENHPSMIVYFLLNEPLDIYSVDENGSTALHWACYSGAEESVKYLVTLKSDINALDKEKLTPLHLAVDNNRENIVRFLLQKGVEKKVLNNKKELPIDIARRKNFSNIEKLLLDKEFNQLCTLEYPVTYIPPSDSYKKVILLMIIIPEIIIIIIVFPVLENMYHIYINFTTFFLSLISYIILLLKDPGYIKNDNLLRLCGQNKTRNDLLKFLVENNYELKDYCPICLVENKNAEVKHCFICNKCVLDFNHHCFWFNKCIAKSNKIIYLLFIIFSFLYAIYSIFIDTYLLFDTVNIPYEKIFPPSWLIFEFDRGIRVLGAGLVIIFSVIVSFPLFSLYMIQIFKAFKCLGKKKEISLINIDDDNDNNELENKKQERLLDDKIEDENNIKINIDINNIEENNENNNEQIIDEKNNEMKIPNEKFPIVDNNRISNES